MFIQPHGIGLLGEGGGGRQEGDDGGEEDAMLGHATVLDPSLGGRHPRSPVADLPLVIPDGPRRKPGADRGR